MRYALALSLWIILVGGCATKAVDANTREHLISGYAAVLKSWDKDGDRKLSYAEVGAMVGQSFERIKRQVSDGKSCPYIQTQRRELMAFYQSQDANHDGYLTLDELLKLPLENFDCMDENHDSKLSHDEIVSGMDRCPSVNLDNYALKR